MSKYNNANDIINYGPDAFQACVQSYNQNSLTKEFNSSRSDFMSQHPNKLGCDVLLSLTQMNELVSNFLSVKNSVDSYSSPTSYKYGIHTSCHQLDNYLTFERYMTPKELIDSIYVSEVNIVDTLLFPCPSFTTEVDGVNVEHSNTTLTLMVGECSCAVYAALQSN